MWRRKKRQANEGALDVGAGLIGAKVAAPEVAASDATREGMDLLLRKAAELKRKDFHLRKGHLFEYIEAAKLNQDLARKEIPLKVRVTHAEGRHTDRADLEIISPSEKVIKRAQLKSHEDGPTAVSELNNPKYDGMHKQTLKGNSGGASGIKEELDIRGASSGGTTKGELEYATNKPKGYARIQEIKQVGRESLVAGGSAAAAGAVMEGSISAVKNMYAYSKGEKDGKEALADIVADSAKSGIRSGSTGALESVIRHAGSKVGSNALTKSNVATAVASGVVGAGVTVYEFARGDITAEEAAERLGDTGCSTLSGIYVGAAGGAVFGPPGAIVGAVVGYMLSTSVYQACIAIFKEAKLGEKEAERVEVLCEEAANAMDRQRREFEAKLATYLKVCQASFNKHFRQIDDALLYNDHARAIKGLSGLARSFGKELKLAKFEDFRESMIESREPLVL